MTMFKPNFHCLLAVLVGATVIAYLAQRTADSGVVIYGKIFSKIILAAFSYLAVFLMLPKKNQTSRKWRLPFLLAILGTVANLVLVTIFEAYQAYRVDQTKGISSVKELFQFYLKELILRLLILTPIDALIFFTAFISSYLLLRLVGKTIETLNTRVRRLNIL